MKALILFILVGLISTEINYAQINYKVVKVDGTIIILKSNLVLQQGMDVTDNIDVDFRSDEAFAVLVNPSKGRFFLKPNNDKITYLKANLTPQMKNISSRAGEISNKTDIENHFVGKYVILENVNIKINPQDFPMNTVNFFYIRYNYKGEVINKKLSYSNDTLFVKKNELLTIDGKQIPNPDISEMKLYYMQSNEDNKSTLISSFNPVFLNTTELKNEIQIIFDNDPSLSKEERINEVNSYINATYGKPNKANLEDWLSTNFKLN